LADAYQDQLEGARVALAVLRVALLAGSAKHRAVTDELPLDIELRWGGDATPVSGGGIPHEELVTRAVEDEDAPVADAEQVPAITLVVPQGQGRRQGYPCMSRHTQNLEKTINMYS